MTPPYRPEPCPKCGVSSECVDWCEVDTGVGLQTFDPEYRCPTHGVFAFKSTHDDADNFWYGLPAPVFQDDDR